MGVLTPVRNMNLCALAAIERRPTAPYLFGLTDRQMICLRGICENPSRLFEFCDDPFAMVTLNLKNLRQAPKAGANGDSFMLAAKDLMPVHGAILIAADALLSGGRTDVCVRMGLASEGATILRGMLASPKEYLFASAPWFVASPMLIEKLAAAEGEIFSTRLAVLAKTLPRETA